MDTPHIANSILPTSRQGGDEHSTVCSGKPSRCTIGYIFPQFDPVSKRELKYFCVFNSKQWHVCFNKSCVFSPDPLTLSTCDPKSDLIFIFRFNVVGYHSEGTCLFQQEHSLIIHPIPSLNISVGLPLLNEMAHLSLLWEHDFLCVWLYAWAFMHML